MPALIAHRIIFWIVSRVVKHRDLFWRSLVQRAEGLTRLALIVMSLSIDLRCEGVRENDRPGCRRSIRRVAAAARADWGVAARRVLGGPALTCAKFRRCQLGSP
jgi:hypothetical protein